MISRNESGKQPLTKLLAWAWLIVSLVGFADATYLTAKYYQGVIPTCDLTGGCEAVLNSSFATMAEVPIALLGSIFYLLAFGLMFYYLENHNKRVLTATVWLATMGFLVTLGLIYIQAFVLQAFCQFCLLSAATSTLLFIIVLIMQQSQRAHEAGFITQGGTGQSR